MNVHTLIGRRGRWATLAAMVLLAAPVSAEAATATNLEVRFSKGQVFVTFTELAGQGLTYNVYRSASPIATVSGLTPVAVLPQNSGLNLYTNQRFVVTDLGSPLSAGVGLYVHTSTQNGAFHYAVTTSQDSSVAAGVNATTSGLQEHAWEVPGAVQIGAPVAAGAYQVVPYFAWEDYSAWDPSWGYYGHRFNVATPVDRQPGQTLPLVLDLHGAGASSYQEPPTWIDIGLTAVFVFPVDHAFSYGNMDPYSGTGQLPTAWFGYVKGSGGSQLAISATERRVVRYTRMIASDPQYQVDPTRLYVKGASMGGGGAMHVAMHHPTVFAAAAASIAWVGPSSWGDWTPFAADPPVDSPTGPRWSNWQNGSWLVEHVTGKMPPIIHTFRKDDNIIPQWAYPELLQKSEQFKRAYIARWQDGGHNFFWLDGHASFARFRLNEAYPAFVGASNSDSAANQEGQRNLQLDWSSSLHDLGAGTPIVDTPSSFAMSFKSLSGDATANVTFRNLQLFHVQPNASISWTNVAQMGGETLDSGTVQADAQGLVTLPLQIKASGNRVTLTNCPGCPITTFPPSAPRNVRITGVSP